MKNFLTLKNYFAIFFVISLFVGAVIAAPQQSFAALEQPAGEFPINEPLHPMEPGTKPNYSGNIQSGEQVNLEETAEEPSAINEPNPAITDPAEAATVQPVPNTGTESDSSTGNWKYWLAGLILIIVVGGGVWAWRRKPSKTTTAVILAAIMFSGLYSGFAVNPVFAQHTDPNSNKAIQRTITVEGEDPELGTDSAGQANTGLFGLTAAILVLIAGGAGYFFWTRSSPQKTTVSITPPKL